MKPEELIDLINKSPTISKILDVENLSGEFKRLAMILHPDKCTLPGASDAMSKLNQLRDRFVDGIIFKDDAGQITWKEDRMITFDSINVSVLRICRSNLDKISIVPGKTHNILKYLPSGSIEGTPFSFTTLDRCVPLHNLLLPQEHVNWVLSRLLEFSLMIADLGYSHCGLNPESVFICPETHGIVVVSFYHVTKLGEKVGTVSGKYQSWYPAELFADKKATEVIDIELSKRLAVYLLGDPTGIGTGLRRKGFNQAFLDFVLKRHTDPLAAYREYREMLGKNFEKKFHILNM